MSMFSLLPFHFDCRLGLATFSQNNIIALSLFFSFSLGKYCVQFYNCNFESLDGLLANGIFQILQLLRQLLHKRVCFYHWDQRDKL